MTAQRSEPGPDALTGAERPPLRQSGTPRVYGGGPAWWEIAALVQIASLGAWLVVPSLVWAGAATLLSAATVVLAARGGMPVRVGVAVIGLAGSGAALHTSWQVQSVEDRWDEVHENLIQRASERLESTLANAVASVRALADRGATLAADNQEEAFALLEGGLAGRSPERGIVLFDENGEPWAWAGRMRLPTTPEGPGLYARMTPFYVAIEAQRQVDGRIAVGRVLLAADSAVPDRDGTVTARFARATGSQLEFFRPDNAPQGEDVFDYCLPACDAADVVPDTLFSVRPVPPTQGTFKLSLLDRGGRRVAIALATALAALAIIGQPWLRWIVAATATGLFVVTPLGTRLGLEGFFSSRNYFLTGVGWVSITAGVVFVLAAFGLMALGPVRRHSPVRPVVAISLAAVLVGLGPFLLEWLASGVAPSANGVTWSAWIGWTLAVAAAVTAVTLGAGIFIRWAGSYVQGGWALWSALAVAFLLAGIGLVVWQPGTHWPAWYTAAWVPAFLLATLPARKTHLIVSTASVAGIAAALLVWGAVIDGRLLLAERDVQRLGPDADPAPIGFLEQFGEDLQAAALPRSSAELYLRWRGTPLSRDYYPAVLVTWDANGAELARLELARLDIQAELLRLWARDAATGHDPTLQVLGKVPGVHHVLSVPHTDGAVVTVAVGPRSLAIPTMRVARFLRGDRPVSAPYEMTFSDLQRPSGLPRELVWNRDGMTVGGERSFDVPGGVRHLHVEVSLGEGAGGVLIRGALLTFLNVAVVALFWLAGEGVRGRFELRSRWERFRGQSYRRRLTLVLGVFFLVPTLGFAAWSVSRLSAEVGHTRDVEIRQTLRDAAGTAVGALMGGERDRARLTELANRLDAELALYQDGRLAQSSAPILGELGLLEPYLAPSLFRRLVLADELETTADRSIGGRPTRVGYRTLSTVLGSSLVLAAPRLVEETGVLADIYAVLLAAILGIAAAVWLAQRAADTLAEPVQALRDAATAVGRGDAVPPFDPRTPGEFVPVVTAFERMARDVQSHRRALEEALQFTETVLRNVATGVITLDARLRITTANPRAAQLLGVDPVPSGPVATASASVWAPLWSWVQEFVASDREIDAAEFTVGDMRIRAQVAALTTEEGGCVVAVDDATELAMAERVLAWGEMARQVAHEIKNPLTPIRLGVQHLQRSYRDRRGDFSKTLDRTARQILAEIERLDAIARAFSRFGAPPVEGQPMSEVDLAEVARETASLYALGGGTEVRVQAENGRRGHLRRDEFKEVLVNLIENARGAGATEVVIEVTGGGEDGTGGCVRVRDNGVGIPPDNLARIFEPHFSTTTSGTGLGLAICKRLVESWGGSITAESRVGLGTTVVLDLR